MKVLLTKNKSRRIKIQVMELIDSKVADNKCLLVVDDNNTLSLDKILEKIKRALEVRR